PRSVSWPLVQRKASAVEPWRGLEPTTWPRSLIPLAREFVVDVPRSMKVPLSHKKACELDASPNAVMSLPASWPDVLIPAARLPVAPLGAPRSINTPLSQTKPSIAPGAFCPEPTTCPCALIADADMDWPPREPRSMML